MKASDKLISIGIQLERVLRKLPPDIKANSINLKNELSRLVSAVERAGL